MVHEIYPHTFSNAFIPNAQIKDEDYVFQFNENALLIKRGKGKEELPRKKDLGSWNGESHFLFTLNNTACFLVWECAKPQSPDFFYHEIKYRNPFAQKEMDWCSGVALQLRNWYQNNRYCGKCGKPTKAAQKERAIVCAHCENTIYPNISPAIIVAILRNEELLLARGRNWPEGFFSLVAGYVDAGETIEDAVIREAKEEVGLDIVNLQYLGSEPWPFSGSMMIGYVAEAKQGQEIEIDNNEIVEAHWYTKDNLPDHPTQRSISGLIIEKFAKGELYQLHFNVSLK